MHTTTTTTRLLLAATIALLALAPLACSRNPAPAPAALSDKDAASIRAVLKLVSNRQIHPIADGDNTPVATIAALEAARPPEGISWSYPWGVTLYGVIRASDFLDDKSALDFALRHNDAVARNFAFLAAAEKKFDTPATAAAWRSFLNNRSKNKIGGLMRLGHLDSCGAMGVQFLEGMLRHPDRVTPAHRAVVERIADWVVHKQERLPATSRWPGTFWREKSADGDRGFDIAPQWPQGTIWIDDLYMGGTFLVRYYQFTKNEKHLDDAARQIIAMADMVQDKDGIWLHAYSIPLDKRSPVKWSRANGWAMVSTVECLSAMRTDHPLRPKLLDILRRHIDGIRSVQAPSGMWRQVLDDPSLWEETSGTAMFAYSIARAVNCGWVPATYLDSARKAFAAICANHITADGKVNGTCRGTNIGQDVAYYAARPRPDDELHGRGVFLLAGAELLASRK